MNMDSFRTLAIDAPDVDETVRLHALGAVRLIFRSAEAEPFEAAVAAWAKANPTIADPAALDPRKAELWRSAEGFVRDQCGPSARLHFVGLIPKNDGTTLRVSAEGVDAAVCAQALAAALDAVPAERIVRGRTAAWLLETLDVSGDCVTDFPRDAWDDLNALTEVETIIRGIAGPGAGFDFD